MFMEPNPSWLLGFTFLTFSQKQLHPELERDFITLFHDAQRKVIKDFGFQLKSYNFRYNFQFSNKRRKMYLKLPYLPPTCYPLSNFFSSISRGITALLGTSALPCHFPS